MKKTEKIKPLFPWVGGKTQIKQEIISRFPFNCENILYIEPFVGGGAVLLDLLDNNQNFNSIINDINPDIIFCYQIVQLSPQKLIKELRQMSESYLDKNKEERKSFYLRQRTIFNHIKTTNSQEKKTAYYAALVIFLIKTGFNGLYRLNSKKEFNVPHGKKTNPKIFDEQHILKLSRLLKTTTIKNKNCFDFFDSLLESPKNTIPQKTLIYLDPPYRPISKTANFTNYFESFTENDQLRLADYYRKLSDRGYYLIMSNSFSEDNFFQREYKQFNIHTIYAKRNINCDPSKRGKIKEILITNYQIPVDPKPDLPREDSPKLSTSNKSATDI
ncbi:Dam family site-specific DNA-(adenine-N6)-methyltransferase [Arthrospira platensis SPKY1]|nr:Dam family site-specific DNA-(adenine-N6)-methyltransferase [Arthrospira platensis SPKY1]